MLVHMACFTRWQVTGRAARWWGWGLGVSSGSWSGLGTGLAIGGPWQRASCGAEQVAPTIHRLGHTGTRHGVSASAWHTSACRTPFVGALCDSIVRSQGHTFGPCQRMQLHRLCGGGRNPGAGGRARGRRGSWGAGGPAQRAVPLQPALALSQEPHDRLHSTGPPTAGAPALSGMPLVCCMEGELLDRLQDLVRPCSREPHLQTSGPRQYLGGVSLHEPGFQHPTSARYIGSGSIPARERPSPATCRGALCPISSELPPPLVAACSSLSWLRPQGPSPCSCASQSLCQAHDSGAVLAQA